MSAAGRADTPKPMDVLRRCIETGRWSAFMEDNEPERAHYRKALAAVEKLVWRGVLLEEACERMGDRGIEESAPAFRAALALFVSGKEGGQP